MLIIFSSYLQVPYNFLNKKSHYKYTFCQQLTTWSLKFLSLPSSLYRLLFPFSALKTLNAFPRFCSYNEVRECWVLNLPFQEVLSFPNMNHHILSLSLLTPCITLFFLPFFFLSFIHAVVTLALRELALSMRHLLASFPFLPGSSFMEEGTLQSVHK